MSPEAGTSCALARRALQYLISRATAAIDARSDEAWAAACAARVSARAASIWAIPFSVTKFGCWDTGRSGKCSTVSASCSFTTALLMWASNSQDSAKAQPSIARIEVSQVQDYAFLPGGSVATAVLNAITRHRVHQPKTRKPASRTAQGGISWGKSREWKLPIDKPAIAAAFPGAANLLQSESATAAAVPEKPALVRKPKSASPVF
jgi:hypothetical protein